MEARETKRTSSVDLDAVCKRLDTQAQKLQFGVLNAVDFVFQRFKETNPEQPDVLDKMKAEMIVGSVMQAVNAVRGQSRIIRELERGNLTINKHKREVKT